MSKKNRTYWKKKQVDKHRTTMRFLATSHRFCFQKNTGSKQIAKKGVVTWLVGEAAGFPGEKKHTKKLAGLYPSWNLEDFQKWRSLLNQRCFSILNLEGMKIVFQSSIFWDRFGKYQRCWQARLCWDMIINEHLSSGQNSAYVVYG